MKRREFVGRLGVGSAALMSVSGAAAAAGKQDDHHDHQPADPNTTNASVSFGAWPTGGASPTDRFALPNAPQAPNVHQLFPHVTTIKAGSSVNFMVAGFHLIAIYGPGTKFEDVNGGITSPLPGAPPGFPPAVDDTLNRIYRGLNPLTTGQDRVEVVHFPNRGTYLVVCAFLPHFNGGMYGYVRVLP
jgi:plastocyanin